MRVYDIAVIPNPVTVELRATVASERSGDDDEWFAPFMLWYRYPRWCQANLSAENGDPFLAALLLPAMRVCDRLLIEAPISARLAAAIPEIQAMYAAFDPASRPVPVDAVSRIEEAASPPGERVTGLFFSMGVDSFYSLLKNGEAHPHDELTVTHLLSVHGFDAAHHGFEPEFPTHLLRGFQAVAAEMGKTLVPVATNVRQVGARLAPWTMLHGGAMASVALALGPFLRSVTIAASTTYDALVPWGTHPLLDPLWSTETLAVRHDGCELDTIDKTRIVGRHPVAQRHLRVCPGFGPPYNCGRCMKCLRTMLDLLIDGTLDRCQTLPHEIDADVLRVALHMPVGPVHVRNFRKRQAMLEASGLRPDLNAVLIEHLRAVSPQDQVGSS